MTLRIQRSYRPRFPAMSHPPDTKLVWQSWFTPPARSPVMGPAALSSQVDFSAVRFETHGAARKSSDMRYGPIALLGAGLSL